MSKLRLSICDRCRWLVSLGLFDLLAKSELVKYFRFLRQIAHLRGADLGLSDRLRVQISVTESASLLAGGGLKKSNVDLTLRIHRHALSLLGQQTNFAQKVVWLHLNLIF